MAAGRDSDEESDASHASMPELLPVTSPGSPRSTATAAASPVTSKPGGPLRRDPGGQGALSALQKLGFIPRQFDRGSSSGVTLGRSLARFCGSDEGGASDCHDQPVKRKRLSCLSEDPIVKPVVDQSADPTASGGGEASSSFRLAGVSGASFGPRVNALADVLDRLAMPSSGQPTPDAGESLTAELEMLPQKGDANDVGVEVNDATEIRLRMGRDAIDISLEEGADEESSGDEQESAPSAKRRRVERAHSAVPPGAPAAAPASLAVAAAAATFPLESCGRATSPTGLLCSAPLAAKTNDVEKCTGATSSFGPRFCRLPTEELSIAKAKWKLHSLSDVRTASAQENRNVASALFDDLRRRREGRVAGEATGPKDSEAQKTVAEAPCKPVFRRPVSGSASGADEFRAVGPAVSRGSHALPAGGRMMQDCVPGTVSRRSAAGPRPAVACETGEEVEDVPRVAGSGGQARRAARSAACAARQEDLVAIGEALAPGRRRG